MDVADENQKWLSSKLEASLMEALDEKAKSIGLSRSEAVRKAIEQWTDESSGPASGSSAEILQRLQRIESKLHAPEASTKETSRQEHDSEEETNSEEEQSTQDELSSVQMYEGDELLDWIEKEGEKSESQ